MADGRLNLHERYRIHTLSAAGLSLRAIACQLDRAPSTISRELRRNRVGRSYQAERARVLSESRRSRASARPRIDALHLRRIEALLPTTGALDRSHARPAKPAANGSVGTSTPISAAVASCSVTCAENDASSVAADGAMGRGQLRNRRSMHDRPRVVERRTGIGDWEVDTLYGRGKAVIVTMTERRSRLHLLARSPDRKADNVARAIIQPLGRMVRVVHTLTADNSKEFAGRRAIETVLQADFYFADACAAWQRGSNENANGLTRHYLPCKLNFATVSDRRLRWIEVRLNTRQRETLAFRTPLDVFAREARTVANQS